jgi:hypothetical protein
MDAKLFRLPTAPNFYAALGASYPFDKLAVEDQVPSPDSRFPGWAAPMSDGRLVTSYTPHCTQNIPAGKQFPTKEWMTKQASGIIETSRNRFSKLTGAMYGLDPTVVPPPATLATCTKEGCTIQATKYRDGIGMERAETYAPELFGTWNPRTANQMKRAAPASRTQVTTKYEWGLNTPRGTVGPYMA